MRYSGTLVMVALLVGFASAEDIELRTRAVRLVERSAEISAPTEHAPYELSLTFRAMMPGQPTGEGSYSRLFGGKLGSREEATFGDFHLVKIYLPDRVASIGKLRVFPPELREVLRLIPIQLWHLDHEDIVREIRPGTVAGRPAQCVEFDTIAGAQTHANEICVDAQTGAFLRDVHGNEVVENSDFFDNRGAKFPAHINYYRNGVLVFEINQTIKRVDEPLSADMFTPPADAKIGLRCQSFRRAFAESTPQPPRGNGSGMVDVVVHAMIGLDGHAHNAVIESSDRPDLNQEALKIVQNWVFTPSLCNDKPNEQEGNLVVHFQGR